MLHSSISCFISSIRPGRFDTGSGLLAICSTVLIAALTSSSGNKAARILSGSA
jgi:hypothetical protein